MHGVFNDMPKLTEGVIREASKFDLGNREFYYQDVVDPVIEDILSFLPDVMPDEEVDYSSEYSWPYPVNVDAWAENWGDDSIPEFDVEVRIVPVDFSPDHPGWNIDGSAGEGSYLPGNVQVEIQVSPGKLFDAQLLMALETELVNVVAHELHHLTQDGGPLERPSCPLLPARDGNTYFDYFTSACEVPAFLIGFRAQASRTGSSVEDLISRYLDNQKAAKLLSAREAEEIANRWINHDLWSKQ